MFRRICNFLGAAHRIEVSLYHLTRKVSTIMATSTETLELAKALRAKVEAFGPAVDAAEARLTAAIAAAGGVPPAVQAEIDATFVELSGAASSADTISADLADGVDEAAA